MVEVLSHPWVLAPISHWLDLSNEVHSVSKLKDFWNIIVSKPFVRTKFDRYICIKKYLLAFTYTLVLKTKEASAVYRSKMAFFKRAWQKVKVMSRPWALGFKSEMIRPLKWGTLGSRTHGGSKNTSRQSFIFFLPTLTICIFGTTGSSETLCTSFERSDQC